MELGQVCGERGGAERLADDGPEPDGQDWPSREPGLPTASGMWQVVTHAPLVGATKSVFMVDFDGMRGSP
jgi:hypothetical protein